MNGKLSLFFTVKSISEKKFKFHGSLDIPQHLLPKNARYLQRNFADLEQIFMLRSVCTDQNIKIGITRVYFSRISNHGINFIGNLVDINGKYKVWDTI